MQNLFCIPLALHYLCEKYTVMASITLAYNPRNRMAQKTIDYILSLGIFKKIPAETPFAESDEDIEKGRIYDAKDADDLIRKCLN